MRTSVLISIVTFHSTQFIERCLRRIIESPPVATLDLSVLVIDNSPRDSAAELANRFPEVKFIQNLENLGFCGGQNQGVGEFLRSKHQLMLMLNPDVSITKAQIATLAQELLGDPACGMATPLLLRANSELELELPARVDAAGMILNCELRHLDRDSGRVYEPQNYRREEVFGGTGACLMLKRSCIEALILDTPEQDEAVYSIYPQLRKDRQLRGQLFDEAFFAYREDADLAWRAQNLGIGTLFVPSCTPFHVRLVVPERRNKLPRKINLYSVRNRFLLQLNNYTLNCGVVAFVRGLLVRNLFVLCGVLAHEHSSLPAFLQVLKLLPRARARRRELVKKQVRTVRRWIR